MRASRIWGSSPERDALTQVAELCRSVLNLDVRTASDELSFRSLDEPDTGRKGIIAVSGRVADDKIISVSALLLRSDRRVCVNLEDVIAPIAESYEKIRPSQPVREANGEVSFPFEMRVQAVPMDGLRERGFITEIKRLDELARKLQEQLPTLRDTKDLLEKYKEFSEVLRPIQPVSADIAEHVENLTRWARKTLVFLKGSLTVAVPSPFPIEGDLALSVLAGEAMKSGLTVASVLLPGLQVNVLRDLAGKAPGVIVVPAVCLTLGTNPYDLGREIRALLASLFSARRPVVFTGTLAELQGVFHGGQGGESNPHFPVVRHVPRAALEALSLFAVRSMGRIDGGLPERAEADVARCVVDGISALRPDSQRALLPIVVSSALSGWKAGLKLTVTHVAEETAILSTATETLSGLGAQLAVDRRSEVQERFEDVLGDREGLFAYLTEHIIGQEEALNELVNRLHSEVEGEPHKPICYMAEGGPGIGKTESARLLAKRLDVPYENIDCASISDQHTAVNQLFGSAPGYVDSHQPGRLERVAKHHTGVVVEVSDLDHADPRVREHLATLFLQVLDSGVAQSQKGYLFSCANVIFAFTMNLPDGMDEAVTKAVGFMNSPSREDIRQRVVREIKRMFTAAFISRVGEPIIFEALDEVTAGEIVERTIRKAVTSMAMRRGMHIKEVMVEQGLGKYIVTTFESHMMVFGAREIIRRVRRIAAEGFREMLKHNVTITEGTLAARANSEGTITIEHCQGR